MSPPIDSAPSVLVVRAGEAGEGTAARLAARGYRAILSPLLRISPLPIDPFAAAGVQAILTTSANGAARLSALDCSAQSLPVFAVGETSAAAARAVGFARTCSADGDARDLARLVQASLRPDAGPLLHLCGREAVGALAEALAAAGFEVRVAAGYSAEREARLTPEAENLIAAGRIDAVAVHSPRLAEALVGAVRTAGLDEAVRPMVAAAISPAALEALAGLAFAHRAAASRPREAELLAALDDVLSRRRGAA